MHRLLIVTREESDFSKMLQACFDASVVPPDFAKEVDLDAYDGFALLGGTREEPIVLQPPQRLRLDAQIGLGKPFFAEYVRGIRQVALLDTESTRFQRPVFMGMDACLGEFPRGDILDEQDNNRLKLYRALNCDRPILQYVKTPEGFYTVRHPEELAVDSGQFALWLDEPNLLVCAFRLCNCVRARFAPRKKWIQLLENIVHFLGGAPGKTVARAMMSGYSLSGDPSIENALLRAAEWFKKANMLVDYENQPYSVKEGLGSSVFADGAHPVSHEVRTDCVGECALMYELLYQHTGRQKYRAMADGLYRMPRDMQIAESCPHRGMVRGSATGWWGVSYQDDTARGFLFPLMWRALLTGDRSDLPRVELTLDYLASTTGSDGLRAVRVDFFDQNKPEVAATGLHRERKGDRLEDVKWAWGGGISGRYSLDALRHMPADVPSAHYNAAYLGALFMGWRILGKRIYLETALKGMDSLLAEYPFTAREHSETEELARLLMPLALRYWATEEPQHREWIHRVADDLQRFRRPSGAYAEWDTGYTATCAGVKEGESSVLSANGDPVVDFLYSSNWLPMGYATAWLVTGEEKFHRLWREICAYCASTQILSGNPLHNGIWPRAIDDEQKEVYGVPNDSGWAPWAVETGWTMAEIVSGMLLGHLPRERFLQLV